MVFWLNQMKKLHGKSLTESIKDMNLGKMLLDVFFLTPCFRQFTHIHLEVELRIEKGGHQLIIFTLPGFTSAFFTVMLFPLILCSLTCILG